MNKHKVTQIVIAALLITAVLSMGAFSLAGAEETGWYAKEVAYAFRGSGSASYTRTSPAVGT